MPPGPGNALTYTSKRPVSFEVYAIHRPFGENRLDRVSNFVRMNGNGFRSPVNGRIHNDAAPPAVSYAMKRPSGLTSFTLLPWSEAAITGSSSPFCVTTF